MLQISSHSESHKPVSTSVAGRTSHRHWVPRYLFTMICGGSEAACYQWVMVWFIDAIQPPCATAHWHGGGWVVGRPPAVGLPSCLHAATGMEEVGWWGDPREGLILTKPFFFSLMILAVPVRLHRVRPLRSGESHHLGFRHLLSSQVVRGSHTQAL